MFTCAHHVDPVMKHLQVEDVFGKGNHLPNCERESIEAIRRIQDAVVVQDSIVRFDNALKTVSSRKFNETKLKFSVLKI